MLQGLRRSITDTAFATLDGVVTAGSVDASKLIYTHTTGVGLARSTAQKSSGKWYFEVTFTGGSINISNCVAVITLAATDADVVTNGLNGGIVYQFDNVFANDASSGLDIGNTILAGEVIGVAVDLDNDKIWFRKSVGSPSTLWYNQAIGSQDPASNVGGASISNYSATTLAPACGWSGATSGQVWTANFGQRAFSLPAPSGFTSGWTQ